MQVVQGGDGSTHLQSASTLSEAIAVLKNRLEQSIIVDSYTYVEVLKWCLKQKDLAEASRVHDCIIKSGMEQNIYVANNLLSVYIRCGRLQEARRVFDELVKKSVYSWTIMIGGYAQHNHATYAMELFDKMLQEGVQPNAITYLSILKACASSPSALEWGKEVHALIRCGGLESDVRVASALLKMYAKCGSIKEARLVFDRLISRDVMMWNVMIGAYAEIGQGHEAFALFLRMQRGGFVPNALTYLSILNARASTEALVWVKEVHSYAMKAGFESDVRVGNAFVHMYAMSGSIENARLVFNRMRNRDLITFNAMIGGLAQHGFGQEAYKTFLQMQKGGFVPDSVTYVNILNACASAGDIEWVKEVHSHAFKAGFDLDLRVGNALVHMYAKNGRIDDARLVFNRMEVRDVITWNGLIGGLAQHGFGQGAYSLFLEMERGGFVPNVTTYLSILNANASPGAIEWVKDVHSRALKAGLMSDVRVGSALVHMYAKSGSVDNARQVFDTMADRNVITWTAMIGGLAQHGFGHEAYRLFLQMQNEGLVPNATTYLSILNPCASTGALEWVKGVHSHAVKAGLELDLHVGNALIHMYAKSGSVDDARIVFDRMENRNLVTWNAMIGGLAQHGRGLEAYRLFGEMIAEGVKPDECSLVGVLTACSHAGLLDEGRRQFLAMTQDYGIEPTVVHHNCMVDLLGRAGHLEEAELFIRNMQVEPDGTTWAALLGACRTYGNVELAEYAAQECLKLEPKNSSAYVLLSNVYAAAGKWEQVSSVRTMMQARGIYKEPGISWIEVDNKIHSFVVGDTSHPEAKEIYAELNKLTKKMKAEGYVPNTQHVLHNIDKEDKELALCSHSEKLAITYGLMRISHGEPIRIYKNLRVCSDCHTATKFISKVTGREIVARDVNRYHHFKDGTCSCGDYW
jgi:pentatricopeptide repeat protein